MAAWDPSSSTLIPLRHSVEIKAGEKNHPKGGGLQMEILLR
jgi:hypothetical protein